MKFISYDLNHQKGIALQTQNGLMGLTHDAANFPGMLDHLIKAKADLHAVAEVLKTKGHAVDPAAISYLPVLEHPGKIICVGLNYADHAKESPYDMPAYPPLFPRFTSSLVGHGHALVKPRVSDQFDYEGEMVAVIGVGGKHISKDHALDHVLGYSICNEGSIRDYQFKSAQWTVGKNFDKSGSLGPVFVTADELPRGAKGLHLETRLNGQVLQSATTADMLFDIPTLIHIISEAITLEPGDILITGTPAGVGFARKPPIFMKAGDVCEVEIEGIGLLSNPIVNEA